VAFYYGKCFFATVATNSHQLIGPRHPYVKSLQPRTLLGIPLSTWLCTLSTSPSPVDAILIPNSKKITLPSELFKGVLDEIASVTCQLA